MKEKKNRTYTHIYETENEMKKEREIYRRYALEANRQVCGSLSSSSFGIDALATLLELPRITRIDFVASPKVRHLLDFYGFAAFLLSPKFFSCEPSAAPLL